MRNALVHSPLWPNHSVSMGTMIRKLCFRMILSRLVFSVISIKIPLTYWLPGQAVVILCVSVTLAECCTHCSRIRTSVIQPPRPHQNHYTLLIRASRDRHFIIFSCTGPQPRYTSMLAHGYRVQYFKEGRGVSFDLITRI